MRALTPTEIRLAALALDAACADGELEVAATKFFRSLRHRKIRVDELRLPDHQVVPSLRVPLTVGELRRLSKRLGRCVCCGTRIL